jgi:hypothetical protein
MILNFEVTLDREKEFSMYENVQSLLMMAQMISPYKLESECVTSDYDSKVTIRLKNFELTEEIIENWNQQSLKMMEMLGCSL